MDPADAPEWGARIEEALRETLEQFETAEAEEGLHRDDADEFSEPQDLHEPEFRPIEPMGALLRVVPAEPARHEGLCVTTVALHEGGFEVHWHSFGKEPYDRDDSVYGERLAADDLGTEYRATGTGGSLSSYWEPNGPFVALGQTGCAPAVPEGARELCIRRAASEWVARLT